LLLSVLQFYLFAFSQVLKAFKSFKQAGFSKKPPAMYPFMGYSKWGVLMFFHFSRACWQIPSIVP
jgi:hypothetical protein